MKDFLKYTLASLLGVLLAGIIGIVLGILSLAGLIATSETPTVIKEPSVFVLDFQGTLQERTTDNPLQQLWGQENQVYGLDDILASIRKAQENELIKGIYLQPSYLTTSFASLEEIRQALLQFKESGKFVVAYADQYSQGMYYLASVADQVIVNPQGSIGWHGLTSQPIFFKDLLKKAGIDVQVFKVGTYKSAVEPFIATEMSEANREQVTVYLNSIWNRLVQDVATSRQRTPTELNDCANRFMDLTQASAYIQAGLADTLMYKDEVLAYLKQLNGQDEKEELRTLFLEDMKNLPSTTKTLPTDPAIAIYYAAGDIVDSATPSFNPSETVIDGQKVTRDLRKLREDDRIKAVVLRVNSPGGSAYASEQIWREVVRLKEKKPVVVSMGDYAASGGYYISCAANRIFADPTTLTGSIGIFGLIPSGEKLFEDKLGLHFDVVKTNDMADMGAGIGMLGIRPFNAQEQAVLQRHVNQGYELFVKRCAEGRNLPIEAIQKIAEGRVWTGETAQQIGLVDELGGIDKAVEAARQLAGLDQYRVLHRPESNNVLMEYLNNPQKHAVNAQLRNYLGSFYPCLQALEHLKGGQQPLQTRLPFEPNLQ
ncbi:signal peptide peptidase SppA, 67K type [gut metagenome]|uniref:Signal peptide peptidase SppA, 67K type n=1 Tax=gut metagenome TaxID=749906 RepID=J9D0H7_9ZZZZ